MIATIWRDIDRLNPHASLQPWFNDWDRFLPESRTPATKRSQALTTPYDVAENDEFFILTCDLPGVSREDLAIELEGTRLTITGERKGLPKAGSVARSGRIHLAFTLPDGIEQDQIQATLENGVLTLSIPKPKAAKPVRIRIGGAEAPPAVEGIKAEEATHAPLKTTASLES